MSRALYPDKLKTGSIPDGDRFFKTHCNSRLVSVRIGIVCGYLKLIFHCIVPSIVFHRDFVNNETLFVSQIWTFPLKLWRITTGFCSFSNFARITIACQNNPKRLPPTSHTHTRIFSNHTTVSWIQLLFQSGR